jgi:selenocysteine lyase/cysteine desulfurase
MMSTVSDLATAAAPGAWSESEIRSVFHRRLHAQPELSGGSATDLETLRSVMAKPEFEPFSDLLRARIDPACCGLWRLAPDGVIHVSPAALGNGSAAAFHLRFAAEFALLGQLAADGLAGVERGFLRSLLALHTALSYYLKMNRDDRAMIRASTGSSVANALAAAESLDISGSDPAARCMTVAVLVAAVAGDYAIGEPIPEAGSAVRIAACAMAAPLLVAAHPAERLLTMGGDDRLLVSEETGLNGYGCSPRPRPSAITFSSSTASSISEQAYGEVEKMRREALRAGLAGNLEAFLDALGSGTRQDIASMLRIDNGLADIVLTASGTDAELIALWLAMGRAPRRVVVNVIVGPEEVGSGSVPAAGGRHFNPLSPLGGAVEPGEMLAGFPSGRIRVEMLPVRDEEGQPLSGRAVHAALARLVEEAVGKEETILLHLVDCSKTGLMSPDLESVQQLVARYPQHIVVVVDAAQMRLSRAMLRHYLDAGFILLITGSKFFTGPPFSGAVVVPRRTLATLPGLIALPPGIAAYATAADFADAFRDQTVELPRARNIGLLARWRAALWEMAAFYAVPPDQRRQTIAAFDATVRTAIANLPELELFSAPARPRIPAGGWDALPSIFTFLIRRTVSPGHRGEVIDYEDGRRVYHWLNCDVSANLPPDASAEDLRLARQCCHTPQPVKLTRRANGWTAGMRIAAGARLVSGVHLDSRLGATREERLHAELRDMQTVLRKAAMIARRWADFASPAVQSRSARPES